MHQDRNRHDMPRSRRLKALAAIAALSLGSLALAGCGNDDEMPPMEPQDPPMEEPAQEAPMGDEPGMGDAMGDQPWAMNRPWGMTRQWATIPWTTPWIARNR
jgi:hypothetical protein